METSNPVFHGLLRKRQEIADKLDATQTRIKQLVLQIDAVDATLRLFDPDYDTPQFRVRPLPRRHEAHRGESARLILSILREAGEPLSHREITVRLMTARGLNLSDRALCRTMGNRVNASLRGMQQRGSLVSGEGKGVGVKWRLASASASPVHEA